MLPLYPELIVNIKTIPGLDYIEEDGERLRIGASARLRDVAGSKMLGERYSVICEAARAVAGPQIRNVATMGETSARTCAAGITATRPTWGVQWIAPARAGALLRHKGGQSLSCGDRRQEMLCGFVLQTLPWRLRP